MADDGNAVDFFLDRHAREGRGAALAFDDGARRLSYAQLHEATRRFAAGLAAAGIAREQRAGLVLLDTVDFPIAFWGCLRAGVIPVPVNTLLPADMVRTILADCRASAAFVAEPLATSLGRLADTQIVVGDLETFFAPGDPPEIRTHPDELAFLLYSSGSTGAPKGVRHVHASLRATADTYGAQVLGIRPDDVVFSAAKLFFAYGLGNSMTFPMSVGASSVLLAQRPTPNAVLDVLRRHRPTVFCGVPTLYAGMLAQSALPSDRLRRCISAGEALPDAVGRRWRERVGVDILDGIGSTEMLHIFLSNRPDDIRYGTTGRAVPGYDLRIVDADGRDVADGESGELLVRGPSAADGYWNQRSKSRQTFRGDWTHTGDTYSRDADGYYRYGGRSDDMMKVGGIWVSPFEVEAALAGHPAVLEAAVVGYADADGLIKPRAFVVLHSGADADIAALQAHVKATVGPWKYPRWIELVESLPKTATGKIQRFKLRA
jgi:4-hydroxybenzoate-CoA ligase